MPKQAVLLIHGIGEQAPMESLRAFVDAVWTKNTKVHLPHKNSANSWSKPYRLSKNFELRRLTTTQNRAGIRTDFFEFYWAHLMHGTKLTHVIAWAKSLLLRWPWTVPKHLQLAYWVLIVLLLFGVAMAYRSATASDAQATFLPVWASWLMSVIVLPAAFGILRNTVGDAARYLHVSPTNVQRRHEIRDAGVKIIKSLHDRGYQRIVVVGHSLGSVIGYDILYHSWMEYNAGAATSAQRSFEALTALEDIAVQLKEDPQSVTIATVQTAQRRYFNELKDNGVRWRVTDFVTLGSPLAHAQVLLARRDDELERKFVDREFPRCLPVLEEKTREGRTLKRFSYPLEMPQRTPHHAAVFGPTRWTNVYFPCRLIVWGDMVGGELRSIFGSGIADRRVRTSRRLGFLSHTLYWKPDNRGSAHVEALRDALDLLDEKDARELPDNNERPRTAESVEVHAGENKQ